MPKTVQLQEETYARLRTYKVGGMTFDDVVRRLMDDQSPEAFHEEYRAWQRRVLANMRKSGRVKPL